MQRMPSPFETRTQALQSAAGGGTTCTTCCSCCVATLTASVLIPYAVFNNALVRAPNPSELLLDAVLQPAAGAASLVTPEPAPQVSEAVAPGTAADGLAAGSATVAPAKAGTAPEPIQGISKSEAWGYSWAVLGMSVLSLVLLGVLGVAFQVAGLLIGAALALFLVLGVFSRAYVKAGRTSGQGMAAGVGVVLLLGVVLSAEVAVWLSMIFR